MDYKGYKLIDKIMLVCRAIAKREESYGNNIYKNNYQAYLVDPSNKKQLEAARHWAKWIEYGPSFKNEKTGKWEREYEIKHEPVEFEFDNNGFRLELLDCAGGSSQGGRLSFWNCLVTKNDDKFVIGINSDMLLDLLKNATFVNGVCREPLIFITQKGKVGMTIEGSETYEQCVKDKELLSSFKKTQTSKFSFGDIVSTATINDVYLGTITQYYKFDPGVKNSTWHYTFDIRECSVTKLKKPITYYLFENLYNEQTLSELLNANNNSMYACFDIKKTCPKRTITGKINMDCSEDDFKNTVMKQIYDYEAFLKKLKESFYYGSDDEAKDFCYFLRKQAFGYGFEPFELSQDIKEKLNKYKIRYIEE